MKIAFYGSSLLSAYWNGAATYYRGMLKALAARGYDITFFEPDVYDRQANRDIDPPEWCRVVVYDGTVEALEHVATQAADFDIVVKASGVGFQDDLLLTRYQETIDEGSPDVRLLTPSPATAHPYGMRRAGKASHARSGMRIRRQLPMRQPLTMG